MISEAVAKTVDANTELCIHGAEVANVALVGVVETLVQQTTGLEFVLNDSSGRIKVRHYRQSEADAATKGIACGQYVCLVGSVRLTPTLHVSALSLRRVASADEISYHTIEVAYAALKLSKGGSTVPDALSTPAKQTSAADPSTPPKNESNAAVTLSTAVAPSAGKHLSGPLTGDALRGAIVEVIRKEGESKADGVHISTIVDMMKATAADSIRSAIAQLVDEGDVYTTTDEE